LLKTSSKLQEEKYHIQPVLDMVPPSQLTLICTISPKTNTTKQNF
jgi:hypothetical protein